jgi:hypothetical protein
LINYWIFQPLFLLILGLLKTHRKLISCMVLQFLFPIFINILKMQMCLMRTLIISFSFILNDLNYYRNII